MSTRVVTSQTLPVLVGLRHDVILRVRACIFFFFVNTWLTELGWGRRSGVAVALEVGQQPWVVPVEGVRGSHLPGAVEPKSSLLVVPLVPLMPGEP